MSSSNFNFWGKSFIPFKKVNLDAMVQRADLTTTPQLGQQASVTAIPVSELKHGRLHFNILRKPLFQRATDDWDVDNIVTLTVLFHKSGLGRAIASR